MIEHPGIYRRSGVATTVGVLSAVYAATFFFGALLHLGVRVPLGFAVLRSLGSYPRPSWKDCARWGW